MAKIDTRTDVQPGWLELPEDREYWAVHSTRAYPPLQKRKKRFIGVYVSQQDAETWALQGPPAERKEVRKVALEYVMQCALGALCSEVRVLRWHEGEWQTLATYSVADYFGGQRG